MTEGSESRPPTTDEEPTLAGAFSAEGVDLTLIRWMLAKSPTERLQTAQDLIDGAWALKSAHEA